MDIRQVSDFPQGAAVQRAAAPPPAPATPAPAPAAVSTQDAAVDRQRLDAAVKHLNKSMESMAQGIEFSIDSDSHATIVKVVDQKTKEVLRQMPSEEALAVAKALDKLQGLLISNQA